MAACDFCNKYGYEVEGLVFSRLGHKVCKDCLLVCEDILAGEPEPKPIPSRYEVEAPSDIPRFLDSLPARSPGAIDWCMRRVDTAMQWPAAPLTLNCGFCGGKGRFVAGPRVMICSSCVAVCSRLLSGDHARLVKLDAAQPVPAREVPFEPDRWGEFSINQLVLLAVGLREELCRRHRGVMERVRQAEPAAVPAVFYPSTRRDLGASPETVLSDVNRVAFECFAPGRVDINLIGGTPSLRRRLARRIHELSRCGRQFVQVDCRLRSWLADLMRAEGGTLFLDHVDALPPDGVERLDAAARAEDRALDARLVTGARRVIGLRGLVLDLNTRPVSI